MSTESQPGQERRPGPRPRLPRLRRAGIGELRPSRLTARDREMVLATYYYRALTTDLVEALFFPRIKARWGHGYRPNPRCQLRLRRLFDWGFLARDEQPTRLSEGRKPFLYTLDRRGADLVAEQLGREVEDLDWSPGRSPVSPMFQDHLIATNRFRVALTLAARHLGFTIPRWVDEAALRSPHMKDTVTVHGKEGGLARVAVVPDGYFQLLTSDRPFHFFLELDRATVSGEGERGWARKIAAYLAHHESGLYARRYGTTGLRILTVTTGDRRLAHLRAITEKVGGRNRFWFTTLARVAPETVLTEPIWSVATRTGLHAILE